MSIDAATVDAVAFDSYGTIVDVGAVEDALADHVDDAHAVSKLWRNRSLGYAMVANAIDEYAPFSELLGHALDYALDERGVDLDEGTREELVATYHELDAFDDVRGGMERLDDAGYDLYVLSNGDPDLLEATIDHADVGDLLAGAMSVAAVERFKPATEPYRHAADRIGTPVDRIAFAAAGWWDVPGAANAGMQTAWVNRQNTLWGPYETRPDVTVETFHDLADELNA